MKTIVSPEAPATIDRKHLRIQVLRAYKSTEDDSYDGGCEPGTRREKELDHSTFYPSILAAFQSLVKNGPPVKPDQIGTFDPQIYCDVRGGGPPRTVEDNVARGHFRCMYDRMENKHGRTPTEAEDADFKAGKIKLKHVTYEMNFTIQLVGIEGADLAELLGVNNW